MVPRAHATRPRRRVAKLPSGARRPNCAAEKLKLDSDGVISTYKLVSAAVAFRLFEDDGDGVVATDRIVMVPLRAINWRAR